MENTKSDYTPPLLSQPLAQEVILHMIGEELKSHKFFDGLHDLGLDDDGFYRADNLEFILEGMGLPLDPMQRYTYYRHIFAMHSISLQPDDDALQSLVWKVYEELQREARKLKAKHRLTAGSESTATNS